ncbi:MAG: ATP-binding protein [Flavobacteriia bacterium]|nr:ATP-binding protein [Flavobacteriia bacterium]
MLIEFKFRNFSSFKDETSFLMTRVNSFKEHLETNVIKTDKDFDLLKSAAIYGANGSGKTNFIRAISTMSNVISNSFSDSLKKDDEKNIQNYSFKLNSETEKTATMFEVSFLIKTVIYRYGFEILNNEIKKEWLYRKLEREVCLFKRNNDKFEINQESFAEGEKYKDDVNSNVLLISHLAQNNQLNARIIFNWFSNVNVISGLYDLNYNKFTANLLLSDPTFKKWASIALKYLEITNIEAGEKEGEIITYHNKYDENNLLIDSVAFNSKIESDGTKKLIHILGPIYDTLRLGRILFIDEFDSKLHPNLSKKLVEFFHKFNKNGAQLIFSAHDSNLLDKDLFRRDQIWFVEKDQFGASSLYSLSEFDAKTVRNTSAFDKKYLANEFGAADAIALNDNLMNLLYE